MTPPKLVEHFFRHEYGRLVAILCHRVGVQYVEVVEDAVQLALMNALEVWTINGLPDSPSAWVFKVARNKLIDELRRDERQSAILKTAIEDLQIESSQTILAHCRDDLLEMLFVCCNEAIAEQSQIVLALKILCGFSTKEIAQRLFISEANVYKRLTRARNTLKQQPDVFDSTGFVFSGDKIKAVNKILYLLFTEGYLGLNQTHHIRRQLCLEAIRLTTLLTEDNRTTPLESCALLALMYFHLARMNARVDEAGDLLLLEEQDRGLWDKECIYKAMMWLEHSAQGEQLSRYHLEAAIAAEHCLAPSFAQTRWDSVVENYLLLEQISPSAVYRLNRAVAVAQWQGPQAGLGVLESAEPPSEVRLSYLWLAVCADLHLRCNNLQQAEYFTAAALKKAPTKAIKKLLEKRLGSVG